MLKKKFPSLTSIGSDGNTAFLRAARAGHLEKVLDQLKNNVDINTSNANGLNALHLASKDGHIQVVDELLKRGANVDSATKKGNTALHIASLAGQEEVVRRLVEAGACVNVQSQNGFTPLYMAAQENHDTVVRFLLANGANQSLATEDGFTPLAVAMQQGHDKVVAVLLENDTRGKVRLPALHIAAKKDDCKAAALLLQNEHNPDVTSKSGFTPLHIAAHYGNEGIANLLLTKGADVNYAAKHNITPLHVAAKWGKANMVAVLLSRGANIEAKTRDGLTPLHCAARSGHEQVVDMLLERGAPISAKTKNGLAALHMSSQGDHVDAARILLYHRAPVDDVTVDYLTALHVAAHCGHVGVARLLLDRKADPNARALNGFTPLHIACKKNRIKVVELLLKHGASIEATTESGLTPLHVASFMGCMNIVIYLVQNEAHPDVKTVRGETPLHLAARANQTDIIRILLRNGAQVDARAREEQTPLHIASRLGNVDIVMLLLQHGASVDSTTKDLYTALHIAAKEGQDEVASVLLENGASLEATTKKGFTPLHLAAKYGNMNVAKLLLRREAPVDAQGKNGVTPLHVASHYDHQNVALLLLEKGASPHATAKNGHTPLHIAARKNQMDIATTLLEYGAKANAESKAGFTPLHLSAQEGHAEMSSLLIEHQAEVNHKAKNGLSPLHLCAQEDRVDVATILIKSNAQVDTTTKAGYTPLHVASHFGQMGMVKLLLANDASANAVTTVNYTPLHQAAQQGHSTIVAALLDAGADPNAQTNQGQTGLSIAQKLGYISVVETLKAVTDSPISPTPSEEKYKVVSPETMQETFMSDSEDEGGDVLGLEYGFNPAHPHVYLPYFRGDSIFTREDTMLSEQPYHYLTVDEMKGLGDDSLPIDVTRDERDNRDNIGPPTAIDDTVSPQHVKETYTQFHMADNIDIGRHPQQVGKLQWRNFLVSFLVDARGGAMRGCRHSGVRVIVPPRRAAMPLRVTCRYLKRDKLPHPPPLMEGEALASRILELGPVGAKFLGPVMIEVPHFGSLRGKEREMVILRSDNGETWREHTFEATDEAIQEIVRHSFDNEEMAGLDDGSRTTRILTTEFPHYIAVVSRVRQEVHAIGPEGGMVSSTVVPQVQAVFPQGALTKKIKVGLQAQPIPAELTAKLLGNRVAVSPIVTVEPRRRKFHKPISLTIPVPQAANKGMINQYSGEAPTLRLLCSITGGTTRAQWEDVTGSTPLTFVNDCVSFTTTVSARFWLMDCRNVSEATKMATELYREAIHVPFMAKFVVFAKRVDTTEARLRVFCMTDDKEDKTLEHQEHFTEVAKSRDVEVLEGKMQYLEFAGNLIPVTKSGDQPKLGFRAFKENRLPFTVRVKDPHADALGRVIFMREPKVAKGDVPQQPICILNIVLPEDIIPEPDLPETETHKHSYITHTSGLQRLSDISNLLGEDWVKLASELDVSPSEVNNIKSELCESSVEHQGLAMLRLWLQGNKSTGTQLEEALRRIGRDDILPQAIFNTDESAVLSEELSPSYTTSHNIFRRATIDKSFKESTVIIESQELKKAGLEKDDDEKKYTAEEKVIEEKTIKDKLIEHQVIEEKTKEKIKEGKNKEDNSKQEKAKEEKAKEEKAKEEKAKEEKVKEEKAKVEKTKEENIKEEKTKGEKYKVEEKTEKEKVIEERTEEEVLTEKIKEETLVEEKPKEEKETEEEEMKKSVSERRKEIEKRLSQEIEEKKKVVLKETKPLMRKKDKKSSEDLPEKETAEEKAVSPEPAHLSFDEKRKSFELGITPKSISLTQADVSQTFIAEEQKAEDKVEKASEPVEEEQLSFQEKRRSFEKGLSMKKPGDKLPASDRLKEKESEKKTEDQYQADYRRDSELFEEVSQGLDRIEKGVVKPHHEILSPMVVKTPPPSPADFSKETQDNKKWSVEEKVSPPFYTTPEHKETAIRQTTKAAIVEDTKISSLEPTIEGKSSETHTELIRQNGITMNTENEFKTDIFLTTDVHQDEKITNVENDAIVDSINIVKKDVINEPDTSSVELTKTEDNSNKFFNLQNINDRTTMVPIEETSHTKTVAVPKELSSEYKHAVVEEIKGMEYVTIHEPSQSVQTGEDVDEIIKQMESQLINSNMLSEETESDTEDSPKPIVTTPSMSRRGLGGSQRLPQGERPTVRIVTDFAEDSSEEEEEEIPYFVTEPVERPKRRNVKFRFDSGDYRDDEESDREGEEKVKAARVEKKFERMASETKELDLEKSDGEFQKMVSQFSVEEMDEALNLWDKGGLTPSDLDSKSLTEPSDETSPQEGTQALEEEETKEAPPPIPSPRSQSIPSDLLQEPEEPQNYVSKKMFWEQVSHGSVEKQTETISDKPPVPKPRLSITASMEKPDYYDTSPKGEVLEIEKKSILPEATPTESVARGISKEESLDDSEIEYIQTHKDELSYDNDAFDMEDTINSVTGILIKKKPIFERSVSLPCDTSSDASNVRKKKRMFEAQIKKEMVVEQLMSQLEEESSPEHKCIEQKSDKPITDTQAMVARQIHTEIFSDELDQQIDSLVPENKELRLISTIEKETDAEIIVPQTSSPDTSISSSVAEVLQYKNEAISKPSDSLEVHVDKSEIEGTEKELDEDLKVFEDSKLQAPFPTEKEKIGSVTSSQGESEDTFSESDVTPEDTRFKEQQDIQDWATQELKSDKKTRNIYTPEEHLPDTVWEVPVQETTESLQEETVQQLSSEMLLNASKKPLTESEARVLAQEIVEDIEVEICKREATLFDKKHKVGEIEVSQLKQQDAPFHVKFGRTDTTTSSMEITDEDLRSSGVESDISPLESQACQVFKDDLSEGDSSEDVENIDLSKETPGEDVLERTLAEVKESLEAVKEELIEEKKKKKDSITKESPSEFEFKVLSLENRFNESIKESHFEEGTVISDPEKPKQVTFKDKNDLEKSFASETKSEVIIKGDKSDVSIVKMEEKSDQEQEYLTKETAIKAEGIEIQQGISVLKESQAFALRNEEQSTSGLQKFEATKTLASDAASMKSELTEESKKTAKSSESYNYDTHSEGKDEKKKFQEHEHKEDRKTSVEESNKKTDIHSSEFSSEDGTVIMKRIEKSEISTTIKCETKHFTEKSTVEEVHHALSDFGIEETIFESEQKEDNSSDLVKSPIQDDLSTSSSSEVKASSDTSVGIEKPSIVIRKHSKSKVSKLHGDVLSDPYSSSGESHYHSFEQTSESLRTPGSRPLSSDIEGLVANLAGITGSSEYESAVSGQSTTVTSRDYQTAVSSLSSRDSMKSLDSESSGNLASMEVSSEASETLVPSAMEYEEMESKTPQPHYRVESPLKVQSISESNGQSVSFDISTEEMSEDEAEIPLQELTQRMKRSHEMTFQPEPRPIVDEKLSSSVDDTGSVVSDSIAQRTVMELSRTESEKMDGSATSDLLTVSGTSDQLSLSESKDTESTKETRMEALSSEISQQIREQESAKVTVVEQSASSTAAQHISTTHSNGPTQVDYNVEYDEVETEVKKRPGHRRNGSTSFRASMIPVFQGYEFEKKSEDIQEDSAESDKYAQCLTSKEGSQEEKKDVDEAEKLEEEFYQTEADQAFQRDIREGRVTIKDTYEYEEIKESGAKSRLSSVAFSEDRPDSELAELLKQCSTEATEDPIERPKTPEPIEECELKDDTPEFSSEAQASVTELEMEYSGAFSRSSEYEAHVSPIREKGLLWQEEAELAEAEAAAAFHGPQFTSLHETIHEDPIAEKHELETHELSLKEELLDRTSPVPGITVTQHMTPVLDESFVFPDVDEGSIQQVAESVSSRTSSETSLAGKEYVLETATSKSIISDDFIDETSHTTDEKTVFEKDISKDIESASDSPTSDSFELLEKPDLADEFVIIEEVGKEAEEQDNEGKSVKIVGKRIPFSHRPPEKDIVSPPKTSVKMTKIKYYSKGGEEEEPFEFESGTPPKGMEDKTEESSQEGSPPSAADDDFKPEVEAGKKWMEMQFRGVEPVAPIYGYDMEFERGPLEDIKEEDLNDLESSSKIGSMGSQVSHSIGSFGSVKESLSSTPDYDVLAGRRFFTRSGEHDDVSMSSLQEFERLENLIALESTKHKSLGSQDSLTSSSNSRKHGSKSGGDDISIGSLKEFEGLENACIAAERIEKKAKAEEESLLSEIEEGHESQASESESCVTVSVSGVNRDSDEEDYEKRMFEIDEIIRQAQTNVEQFMDAKGKEIDKKLKSESLGHADSLEEMTKVPDLDFDQPVTQSKTYCGKTYITQWEDIGEELLTSTDSLELKTQISKTSLADPFTTSTDSLEIKFSQDVMSVSTDSIEAAQRKKAIMTDSIEIGEKSSMITSTDSLEEKVTQANSLDEEEHQPYSSSSGKEVDWSGSGKEESYEGSINRMPPPRAEYMLGSTDSLEPTSSTATHATYQYETDSVMSSSFTSGDSTTMVDDEGMEARAGIWFEEGKPYVTEVIEPGDDEFSQMIHRTVEMPPQITKVSFKGQDAEKALREYIEKFDPGEDISETRDVDASGNVHIKRVVQKRIVIRPEEMGGETAELKGEELEKYLKSLTQSQFPDPPHPDSTETHAQYSSQWTVSQSQGEKIKSELEEKQITDSRQKEHDEDHSDGSDGYLMEPKGPSQHETMKK
ncbi:ankyrin-2 isoform X2 [Halyomorpha halys]|uniref:ankyrin-2 isoform X2 n=1 Tax=Halyomorpha halys TaxID=286706 RepID=UPI0006D4D5EC